MLKQLIYEKNKIRQKIFENQKSLSNTFKTNAETNMLKFIQNLDVFENASSVHTYISKKMNQRQKE